MSAKPLKIPAWLEKPSANWTEAPGMRRAIAVLRTEAKLLRMEGYRMQPQALMRVAAALTASVKKGGPTAEATFLTWSERDEISRLDDVDRQQP